MTDTDVVSAVMRREEKLRTRTRFSLSNLRHAEIDWSLKTPAAKMFRTYAEYVAAYCASALPEEIARPASRAEVMRRMLLSVLNFPRADPSARPR